MKHLNAKEASGLASKKQEEDKARQFQRQLLKEKLVNFTFDGKVCEIYEHCQRNIAEAAKEGKNHCSIIHCGKEFYEALKKKLNDDGFQVNEYTEDEGYCIGDSHHIGIYW